MKKIVTLATIALSSTLLASGYKIPETSLNALALSGATVAHSSKSADSAYYNPANMSFMSDGNSLEVGLIGIHLSPTNYKGSGTQSGVDIDAKAENFLLPTIHYVSPLLNDSIHLGFSMTVPAGLTKRWSDSPALDRAKEFSLEVVELNPTISYRMNQNLSVAFGLRMLHSKGVVKSESTASRDMEGEGLDYGYNVALAYKPTSSLEFGVAYRSQVDLREQGDAKLFIGDAKVYDGGSSVTVPVPALLNVAVAYTYNEKTTLEFVYERNYWSAYKTLDFNYRSDIPAILQPSMDTPISKDWKDSNSYRLGITHIMDKYTFMGGFVIDKTSINEENVSFELPDSDSMGISAGIRYAMQSNLEFGFAMLYSKKESRDVTNDSVDGTFSNSNVTMLSVAMAYKF